MSGKLSFTPEQVPKNVAVDGSSALANPMPTPISITTVPPAARPMLAPNSTLFAKSQPSFHSLVAFTAPIAPPAIVPTAKMRKIANKE